MILVHDDKGRVRQNAFYDRGGGSKVVITRTMMLTHSVHRSLFSSHLEILTKSLNKCCHCANFKDGVLNDDRDSNFDLWPSSNFDVKEVDIDDHHYYVL